MTMMTLNPQTLCHWALLGLLLSPVAALTAQSAELTGKPVPAGSMTASSASAANSQSASVASVASAIASVAADVASEATETSATPPAPPEPPAFHGADEEMEHAMKAWDHGMDGPFSEHMDPDMIIPIVAIITLFGGPVLLVIVLAILYYRAKERRQRNINANIDKLLAAGRDIPVELLMNDETPMPRFFQANNGGTQVVRDDVMLHKGIKNLGLGIGLLVFLTIFLGIKIGSVAFILIGMGISRLVIWKLSGTSVTTDKQQQD